MRARWGHRGTGESGPAPDVTSWKMDRLVPPIADRRAPDSQTALAALDSRALGLGVKLRRSYSAIGPPLVTHVERHTPTNREMSNDKSSSEKIGATIGIDGSPLVHVLSTNRRLVWEEWGPGQRHPLNSKTDYPFRRQQKFLGIFEMAH